LMGAPRPAAPRLPEENCGRGAPTAGAVCGGGVFCYSRMRVRTTIAASVAVFILDTSPCERFFA